MIGRILSFLISSVSLGSASQGDHASTNRCPKPFDYGLTWNSTNTFRKTISIIFKIGFPRSTVRKIGFGNVGIIILINQLNNTLHATHAPLKKTKKQNLLRHDLFFSLKSKTSSPPATSARGSIARCGAPYSPSSPPAAPLLAPLWSRSGSPGGGAAPAETHTRFSPKS